MVRESESELSELETPPYKYQPHIEGLNDCPNYKRIGRQSQKTEDKTDATPSDSDAVSCDSSIIDEYGSKYGECCSLSCHIDMNKLNPIYTIDREIIIDPSRTKTAGLIEPNYFVRRYEDNIDRFTGSALLETCPTALEEEKQFFFLLADKHERFLISGEIIDVRRSSSDLKTRNIKGKTKWILTIKPSRITNRRHEEIFKTGIADDLKVRDKCITCITSCNSRKVNMLHASRCQTKILLMNKEKCDMVYPYGDLFATTATIISESDNPIINR